MAEHDVTPYKSLTHLLTVYSNYYNPRALTHLKRLLSCVYKLMPFEL